MMKLRRIAVGAAFITAIAGVGSAAATGAGGGSTAGPSLQQTALETMQGKKPCGGGNASVLTAANIKKPGGCGCPKECPFPAPDVTCGPDEKVKKVKQDCSFRVVCDGTVIECNLTYRVPTCVPKNGPKTDV